MQKKELMNESYKYEKFNVYFDFIGSDESKNNFKQFLRANQVNTYLEKSLKKISITQYKTKKVIDIRTFDEVEIYVI